MATEQACSLGAQVVVKDFLKMTEKIEMIEDNPNSEVWILFTMDCLLWGFLHAS